MATKRTAEEAGLPSAETPSKFGAAGQNPDDSASVTEPTTVGGACPSDAYAGDGSLSPTTPGSPSLGDKNFDDDNVSIDSEFGVRSENENEVEWWINSSDEEDANDYNDGMDVDQSSSLITEGDQLPSQPLPHLPPPSPSELPDPHVLHPLYGHDGLRTPPHLQSPPGTPPFIPQPVTPPELLRSPSLLEQQPEYENDYGIPMETALMVPQTPPIPPGWIMRRSSRRPRSPEQQ